MYGDGFKDKVAVITGGARGIGLACAANLARLGAKVALWDRDSEKATESAATLPGAVAVAVDVTSEASVAGSLCRRCSSSAGPYS